MISKTRDAPPASMTDVVSPWPTIVSAFLARPDLLLTSSSPLRGYAMLVTASVMILVGSLFESAAATAAPRPLARGRG